MKIGVTGGQPLCHGGHGLTLPPGKYSTLISMASLAPQQTCAKPPVATEGTTSDPASFSKKSFFLPIAAFRARSLDAELTESHVFSNRPKSTTANMIDVKRIAMS